MRCVPGGRCEPAEQPRVALRGRRLAGKGWSDSLPVSGRARPDAEVLVAVVAASGARAAAAGSKAVDAEAQVTALTLTSRGVSTTTLARRRAGGATAGRRWRPEYESKRRPPAKVHSISCADAEWERVRVLAERRGLSISRYMAECGLTVDPTTEAPKPPRLVLDEAEQHRLLDGVAGIAERTAAAAVERLQTRMDTVGLDSS